MDLSFYKGRKVLLTGHTGFKGSWMSVVLVNAGATVIGYSTCGKDEVRLFNLCDVKDQIIHIKGDVRDLEHLKSVFIEHQPEIVIHMAAQPIVRDSYLDPVGTYSTNVMGTVNVLEALRQTPSVKSFLNVTTDKVYENKEWECVRAALRHEDIVVRNPYSTRPYQHVLEPVCAYLMIAAKQYEDGKYAGYYNVGPDDRDCFETGKLVDTFVRHWGEELKWIDKYDGGPHEAKFLKRDCSKLKTTFAIVKVIEWTKCWNDGGDVRACMDKQIEEFLGGDR